MAPWPFRLKASSSTSSNKASSSNAAAVSGSDQAPPRKSIEAMVRRATSKRKQPAAPPPPPSKEPFRQTRTYEYTYSFPHDRQDVIHVAAKDIRHESQNQMAYHPATWDLVPTLHHNRSNSDVVRRKSSHRRKADQTTREADIKAYFVPVRSATHTWAPGSPSNHFYKRAKTMDAEPVLRHPVSDFPPPPPPRGSVHSTLSSESELKSYKVSALEALAPRPTLKCVESRTLSKRASFPSRAGSKKRPFADCEPIPEETLKAHKRIDDLADGFDASELRELMERDARRRERHKQHDREKMGHKLARRAEKQKLSMAEARKSGTPLPENLERGVMGRELVGAGMDPPSAVVTSSRQRRSSEPMLGADEEFSEKSQFSRRPLQFFHREGEAPPDSMASPSTGEQSKRVAEDDEHVAELPSSPRPEGGVGSKKSMSKSTLGSSDKEKTGSAFDDEAITRKDSISSSRASRLSLIALIKWGMRARQNLSSPSSFSNTSREEMQAAAAAQLRAQGEADSPTSSAPTGNFISKSAQSGASKLMRSRFREDLPEFLPNSRVQSVDFSVGEPSSIFYDARESPIDTHRSTEGQSPRSPLAEKMSSSQAVPEPHLSMSFASVDSEGSWLASRINSQRSTSRETTQQAKGGGQVQASKSWDSSLQQDSFVAEAEAEDEEMRESDIKVMGFSTQPQSVQIHKPNRDTIHSHEVLLDMDSENEEDKRSRLSGDSGEKADLQHARRVSLSHIRNYSAGNTKIFQIAFSSGSLRGKKPSQT